MATNNIIALKDSDALQSSTMAHFVSVDAPIEHVQEVTEVLLVIPRPWSDERP